MEKQQCCLFLGLVSDVESSANDEHNCKEDQVAHSPLAGSSALQLSICGLLIDRTMRTAGIAKARE